MGGDEERRSGSSGRHKDRSEKRDRHESSSKKRDKKRKHRDEAEEIWEEAPPRNAAAAVDAIPTSASLDLTSQAQPATGQSTLPLPTDAPTATKIVRDSWMLGEPRDDSKTVSSAARLPHEQTLDAHASREGGTFSARAPTRRDVGLGGEDMTEGFGEGDGAGEYFSGLGSVRQKAPKPDKPDPEKMSRNEINTGIYSADGKRLADAPQSSTSTPAAKRPEPGSQGSAWRMKKLQRTQEAATEENRSIEDVAMERYGSMDAYEDALEERRVLDDRDSRRKAQMEGRPSPRGQEGGTGKDEFGRDIRPSAASPRFLYTSTDNSRSASRQSFRRPGEETPVAQSPGASKPSTPVPSVFTPTIARQPSGLSRPPITAPSESRGELSKPPLSPTSLNRLQAKALKAKLMGGGDAEALEAEYQTELQRSQQGDQGGGYFSAKDVEEQVQVLPTLDGQGRLYDVGTSTGPVTEADRHPQAGQKKRKKEAYVETRDKKTGELLRVNADDDSTTLAELVRQERFGGGYADQNAELANRISTDNAFQDDLDYMDDNVERLARKKMKTDAQKKMFAVNDFARTKRALDTCPYCYQDTETSTVPPQVPIVALATRTYLALPRNEPMVDGHCFIVPLQHHLSSLEADDDTWEEIRNFMKTLMKTFAARDQGVVFMETVLNLKRQHHSVIECVPVPWSVYDDAPAYFREAIVAAESEWSQHKKLIDFSKRPGGFRRAMVPNLPYFMCAWDYQCEQGFGTIVEGVDKIDDEEELQYGEEKTGGSIERTFGLETLGSAMEIESNKWRRPKHLDVSAGPARIAHFRDKLGYAANDWTSSIQRD